MPVIEVRGLTKRFGQVLAVDQMSFEVERGTVTGFLGPNGAGKTTTLRMLLAGLAVLFCVAAARTTVARDVS
jgi:ABC-2 type transport system ATP-binding protein